MPTSSGAGSLMTASEKPLKVAVIGGQGIGKFHAGLYQRLGCQVEAICCSRPETAKQCADELERDFGIRPAPFHQLEDVLALDIDGVSLCTPPYLHYRHLLACLDRGLPVFSEKPLFWDEIDSLAIVKEKLDELRNHQNRRIFVNTSNTHFLDVACEALGGASPSSLDFSFHTQGPYIREGIACDLFPHALSFVLKLFGQRELTNFTTQVEDHSYQCFFKYGEAEITLDLREDPDSPKKLAFALDGRRFSRVQEGYGATYRVFLKDSESGNLLEADDPFKVFLAAFIEYIRLGSPAGEDSFQLDAANLELMASLLLGNAS